MCIGKSFKVLSKAWFLYFWLGVFIHDNNGNKNKERRRCAGVYDFDVFMSFYFIWDVCVVVDIVGRWLIVW